MVAAAVAQQQRGVISREQLEKLGIDVHGLRWALQRGKLVRVFRGVYRFPAAPETWEQRAQAAVLLVGPRAALSHESAAALWQLEGFARLPGPVHVSAAEVDRVRVPGVVAHRTSVGFTPYLRFGLPVTRLARTIVDVSARLDDEALEIVLDTAHHRYRALGVWLEAELKTRESRGHAGVARLQELLRLRAGQATGSQLETRMRRRLRERDLPFPRLQYLAEDAAGPIMAIDFAWPEARVALHGDGFIWHARRVTFDDDAEKRSRLAALEWLSFVVTNQALKDKAWLDRLEETLRRRHPQQILLRGGEAARPAPREVESRVGEPPVSPGQPLDFGPPVTHFTQLRLL